MLTPEVTNIIGLRYQSDIATFCKTVVLAIELCCVRIV